MAEGVDGGFEGLAGRRRAGGFAVVFVTVVLDMLALGAVMPVLPALIRQVGHGDGAQVSLLFGSFGALWAGMQFLAAPVQGALADRFGRRPVIIGSNLGMGADYLLFALAPTVPWLVAGRLISGAAAGSIPAAMAYVADVSAPQERAVRFGMLSGAGAVGMALGPVLGGALAGLDLRAPFWIAAILSLANALYGMFILPESLPRERRTRLDLGRLNPAGAFWSVAGGRRSIQILLLAFFALQMGAQGVNGLAILYPTYRFDWTPANIGLLTTAVGVCGLVVQGGLTPIALAKLGELPGVLIGVGGAIAGLLLAAFAGAGMQFAVGICLVSLGGLCAPVIAAIVSRSVGDDEQGRAQGALNSAGSVAAILAPMLFPALLALGLKPGGAAPLLGAPFLVAAIFFVLVVLLLGAVRLRARPAGAAPAASLHSGSQP